VTQQILIGRLAPKGFNEAETELNEIRVDI
jgi:hypothetical protein